MQGNLAQAVLLDPRPHPGVPDQGVERDVQHALIGQLLDCVQQFLALFPVQLPGLLLEQLVDVRVAAISIGSAARQVVLDPGGGVAEAPSASEQQVFQRLLLPGCQVGRSLHGR